jgi:predicted secreted protein
MTANPGSDVVIQIGDGATPETFTTLGGLQLAALTVNQQALDAGNVSTGAWRIVPDGAGERSVTISGTGIFTGSAGEGTLRANAFSGANRNYTFVFGGGSLSGPFLITRYERAGNLADAEAYAVTFASAGPLQFTAA